MTSPEFALAVACCRASFTGDDPSRIREPAQKVDWPRFVRVARFHRVQGLVWSALGASAVTVPAEAAESLSSDSSKIAATNLRILVEARELRSRFELLGIDLLFVKGLTLAALAYPNPLLKMGWDMDVLIRDGDLERAAAELEARGYALVEPADRAKLISWHRSEKESVWCRPDELLYLELHTRLADNRRLIPGIGIDSSRREVEVAAGFCLPTLAEDELFAYLCVHGASSLWFRLKWITDIAAMLHRAAPDTIVRLYRQAEKLGAGRAVAQALLLADSLYETLGGTALRSELGRSAVARRLAAIALRQLADRPEPREPTDTFFGTAWIHLSQFALAPGIGFKVDEAVRQARHHFAARLARRAARG